MFHPATYIMSALGILCWFLTLGISVIMISLGITHDQPVELHNIIMIPVSTVMIFVCSIPFLVDRIER